MTTPTQHILLVEDEEHLAVGIKFNLEADGYRVTAVTDGTAALKVIDSDDNVDLVVLDIMLPGMSGYTVCETLRESGYDTPVLFLSARSLAEDRARGFDVGGNQFLTKPFDLDELLARVKNLLKMHSRSPKPAKETTTDSFEFGQFRVDFELFEVHSESESQRLTQLEMKLLRYFIENEGRVIPRGELLENVWGMPAHVQTRAVDQFIRRLRKLFEPDPAEPIHILTIRDAGYRFVSSPDANENADS